MVTNDQAGSKRWQRRPTPAMEMRTIRLINQQKAETPELVDKLAAYPFVAAVTCMQPNFPGSADMSEIVLCGYGSTEDEALQSVIEMFQQQRTRFGASRCSVAVILPRERVLAHA